MVEIYTLSDPRFTNEIRYLGKTERGLYGN